MLRAFLMCAQTSPTEVIQTFFLALVRPFMSFFSILLPAFDLIKEPSAHHAPNIIMINKNMRSTSIIPDTMCRRDIVMKLIKNILVLWIPTTHSCALVYGFRINKATNRTKDQKTNCNFIFPLEFNHVKIMYYIILLK